MSLRSVTAQLGETAPPQFARARWWGVAAAAVAVIGSGLGYRALAAFVGDELAERVRLPTPLRHLPMTFGEWRGEDVILPVGVQQIAGNDDFVNRRYGDDAAGRSVGLYVGYTARPRTMLRHRPTVCYPSAGFGILGTREQSVTIGGQTHPVLVHTFLKPGLPEQRVLVLNFYVLSGAWTVDENSFWSLGWRTPNLARDASRYVAQVQVLCQITGSEEAAAATAIEFLQAAAPSLLSLLPGANVAAAAPDPKPAPDSNADIRHDS